MLVIVSLAEVDNKKTFPGRFFVTKDQSPALNICEFMSGIMLYKSPDLYVDTYMSQYTHTQHLFQPNRF